MSGHGGGKSGLFFACVVVMSIEILLLGSVGPVSAAQANVTSAMGTYPPSPPSGVGCNTTWWNPTTWGCTVQGTAATIAYLGAEVSWALSLIGSVMASSLFLVGAYLVVMFGYNTFISAGNVVLLLALVYSLIPTV